MNAWMVFPIAAGLCAIVAGCWLGWQLLRQNGRLLLRIEELEKRFDEWEFGGDDDQDVIPAATNGNERVNRFSNRSLANSKIKRDGLKAGTTAPDFTLPRLDGKGDLSLSELRGKRVLLVFSSPGCGPCNALAPELEKFHREQLDRDRSRVAANVSSNPPQVGTSRCDVPARAAAGGTVAPLDAARTAQRAVPTKDQEVAERPGEAKITVVMISKGEPKENRAKVKEHGLTFPIVLQQQWEISRRYAMFATPIAYLLDEQGVIAKDVAVGVEPILELLAGGPESAVRNGNTSFALERATHPH